MLSIAATPQWKPNHRLRGYKSDKQTAVGGHRLLATLSGTKLPSPLSVAIVLILEVVLDIISLVRRIYHLSSNYAFG